MTDPTSTQQPIGFGHRIQTRLIVGLLLSAILPLAFLGPYALRKAQQSYETQVRQNIQGIAYLVKSQVEDALATGDRQITTWTKQSDAKIAPTVAGDSSNIFVLLQNRFRIFLKGQLETVPIFSEILCVKPVLTESDVTSIKTHAQVLFSTNESHEEAIIFDGFWEQQEGKYQVAPQFMWQSGNDTTHPLPSPFDTHTTIIPIVHAYQDNNGDTVALIGLINVAEISTLIANTTIGEALLAELAAQQDTYALLTEKNGAIITGVFPANGFPAHSAERLLKTLANNKESTVALQDIGTAFIGHSALGHSGWQILALRNSDLAMAPMQSLRNAMIAAIGLLLCIIIVVSIKFAKRITGPVQNLVHATLLASNGNLSQSIAVSTKDEIGVLASCFNHMTLQLRNNFQLLEQKNVELQRLNQLKTEFLANTSHELRTPLNGIIGLIDATLGGAFGKLNETVNNRLQLVLSSANRLKTLINNILDFSASQAKQIVALNLSEINLEDLIKTQVLPQFESVVLNKHVTFQLEFAEHAPNIFADAEKLHQVFTNLIGNAAKFTHDGTITIRTKLLPNDKGEIANIQCEVQDTGIGIPAHLLEKIFDVFFQVDGGSARKYEGTGLGLAIVKQIVMQHGGTVRAESVVGKGSTFIIVQPIRPTEAIQKSSAPTIDNTAHDALSIPATAQATVHDSVADTEFTEDDKQGAGETILVIDDEPINIEVLRAQLEMHHYHVVSQPSGQQAIHYLDTCNTLPDLILLDIMMPEISGYDFCKYLKESPVLKHIPVIMVSAKNQLIDRIYGLNLGALDYIAKPFEKAELLAKVRVYLDLRKMQHSLETLNAELESKVQQRTAELEKAKAKAESLAMNDALTGLPNRNLLTDRLGNTFFRSRNIHGHYFGVAFIDIDNFKVINDSLGHEVGDKLLVAFGERVKACVRELDTLARFGGDEFVLILNGIDQIDDVHNTMDRIHTALKEPFVISGHKIHVSASIGIALDNSEYASPEDLLRDADTAMYQAKNTGKARHKLFKKEMHFNATERFTLEKELRNAIKQNQFQLHYQPIVTLDTGAILGFEALVRWPNAAQVLSLPVSFLEVAEETGLIIPIGQWVLREACRQLHIWSNLPGLHTNPMISVNVSARQFSDSDLVADVSNALAKHHADATKLKLEITESALISDLDKATEILLLLAKQRVGLLLDDFGTGYSSLSYLYRLPFQGLKVDKSFIESMLTDEKQANIIHATVAIGKSLGVTVTAEGVETLEHKLFLQRAGCNFAQGFYFAPPLTAEMATQLLMNEPAWLRNWNKTPPDAALSA